MFIHGPMTYTVCMYTFSLIHHPPTEPMSLWFLSCNISQREQGNASMWKRRTISAHRLTSCPPWNLYVKLHRRGALKPTCRRYGSMGSNFLCWEHTVIMLSAQEFAAHGCIWLWHLLVCIDDQERVGLAPGHVTTVTANLSGHVISGKG